MLVGARRHAAPKLRSIPTPTVSGGFSAELAFVTSQRCETVTVYWICYVRVEASIDFCRICVKWIDCGTMIHNGHSTWEIANTAFPTPVSLAYLTSAGRDIMRNVWKTDAYSLTVCDPYKSIIYGYFSPDATRSRIWSTVQHCIMKACGQFCGACGCLALHTLIGAHYAPCDQFVDQHSPPRLKRTYELQEVCFSERSQHYGVHSETSTHISTHTHTHVMILQSALCGEGGGLSTASRSCWCAAPSMNKPLCMRWMEIWKDFLQLQVLPMNKGMESCPLRVRFMNRRGLLHFLRGTWVWVTRVWLQNFLGSQTREQQDLNTLDLKNCAVELEEFLEKCIIWIYLEVNK